MLTNIEPTTDLSVRVAAQAVAASKRYGEGSTEVRALDAVDVAFHQGQLTSIMGPSGSGKSTLMHCLAGLDRLTDGQAWIGTTEVSGLDEEALTDLRRDRLAFVFQSFNLLPTMTAKENMTLPLDLAGLRFDRDWFDLVVDVVGLGDRLGHRPGELSGGQRQRVAVARALIGRPDLIFADEPTGNLDSRSGAEILEFMATAVRDLGQTIVMVTHDPRAASHGHRVVFLQDGRVVGEDREPTSQTVLARMDDLGNRR